MGATTVYSALCFFFFSSRRRHTRCSRDWSSDVCSSDLPEKQISLFWEDKHTTRFGRMGLSFQKFQRHRQEHIKQRAKETVENLGKWIARREIKYLFLASEEEMEGEIQKQLPAALKKKQVPLTSLDP